MKPMIKYRGGKTKEIPNIMWYIPRFRGRYVEPFFGDGALFFYLEPREAIINDINEKLIKFYKGKLSNRGEMVAVKKPFAFSEDPVNPMNNQWFYDWSDATLYSDGWKGTDFAKTDGFGYSLQRKDYSTMGYEASAWIAAEPTPGK